MAWTTPRTWATAELVTAALLNTHVRDNLNILAAPAKTVVRYLKTSNYTTSTASYQDVDATNLAGSITLTFATRIKFTVILGATWSTSGAGTYGCYDILVDGTTYSGNATHGIISLAASNANNPITVGVGLVTGLTAGAAHTFKLQHKVSNANDTLTTYNTIHYVTIIAEEV